MTTPRNPNELNNAYAVWVFRGQHFNKGVLSALRAYPQVQRLQSLSIEEDEFLVLELSRSVTDAESFVGVVTLAGGEVAAVAGSKSSLDEMVRALLHTDADKGRNDEFPHVD